MKMTILLTAFCLAASLFQPLAARAGDDEGESHYCSAEMIYRDGRFRDGRVECESSFAGKCLRETQSKDAWNWEIVDDSECAARAGN